MAHGGVITGSPIPCAICRIPFRPSVVTNGARKPKGKAAVCPRCIKNERQNR